MKKLLLTIIVTLLAIAAAVGVTVAVTDHYNQNKKTQPTPVATIPKSESDKKIAETKSAADASYKALVGRFNQLVTECQKGSAAYVKLTPVAKNQVSAPTCAPEITATQ